MCRKPKQCKDCDTREWRPVFPTEVDDLINCIAVDLPSFGHLPKFSGRPSPKIRASLLKTYYMFGILGRAVNPLNFILT